MEDVRYLYQTELPMAVRIVEARIVGAEMLAEGHSAIRLATSGSIQVVTKVARFCRALPSSINSSWMTW